MFFWGKKKGKGREIPFAVGEERGVGGAVKRQCQWSGFHDEAVTF